MHSTKPVRHVHFSFLVLDSCAFFARKPTPELCIYRKWYEWRELVAQNGIQCVFMHYQRSCFFCWQLFFFFQVTGSFTQTTITTITCNFHPYSFSSVCFSFSCYSIFHAIFSSFFFFSSYFVLSAVIINFSRWNEP